MEGRDREIERLDREWDIINSQMGTAIKQLSKSEQTYVSKWNNKLRERPFSIDDRINRNEFAKELLRQSKNFRLEEPFVSEPQNIPLPSFAKYMSRYLYKADKTSDTDQLSLGLDFRRRDGIGERASSALPQSSEPHLNLDFNFPSASAPSQSQSRFRSSLPFTPDDPFKLDLDPVPRPRHDVDMTATTTNSSNFDEYSSLQYTRNERNPGDSTYSLPVGTGDQASYRDERSRRKHHDSRKGDTESDERLRIMKQKYDAKLHEYEEKLFALSQNHDGHVATIFKRKDTELEEKTRRLQNQLDAQDVTLKRYEKKLQAVMKEKNHMMETFEQELEELKRSKQQLSDSYDTDIEKKEHEVKVACEKEKQVWMRKQNDEIAQLRDEIQHHQQKEEEEINSHKLAMSARNSALEGRVQELSSQVESVTRERTELEKQRAELEARSERMQTDLLDLQAKFGDLEKENKHMKREHEEKIRELKNKHDANLEFYEQEKKLQAVKSADELCDLEQHVSKLKKALDGADIDKQKALREAEESKQKDMSHAEQLHRKKVRSLETEIENLHEESRKKVRKLEQALREKDEEMLRQKKQHKEQRQQDEKTYEEFKKQIEADTRQKYNEMQQQMEKVKEDLQHSRQSREMLIKEFQEQADQDKQKHQQQMLELRQAMEKEQKKMLSDFQQQRSQYQANKEHELTTLRESMQHDLDDEKESARLRAQTDAKMISTLEQSVSQLREQVANANKVRREQLVELGLLREEEKQKMQREKEEMASKLRSEQEQQKIELEKKFSVEKEKLLEENSNQLKKIEKEYMLQKNKDNESIQRLEREVSESQESRSRQEKESAQLLKDTQTRASTEMKQMKQRHIQTVMALKSKVESLTDTVRRTKRDMVEAGHDNEDKIVALMKEHEEKMRMRCPLSVKQSLEEMVQTLKAQVSSLKQHNIVLTQLAQLHKDLAPPALPPSTLQELYEANNMQALAKLDSGAPDIYQLEEVIQQKNLQLSNILGSERVKQGQKVQRKQGGSERTERKQGGSERTERPEKDSMMVVYREPAKKSSGKVTFSPLLPVMDGSTCVITNKVSWSS